jgi:histidine triad (HIT) family protein
VLTTLGSEQHNEHLHWHIAVGEGVARFVARG